MTTPAPTALQQARHKLNEAIDDFARIKASPDPSCRALLKPYRRKIDKRIAQLITEAQLAVHRTKD